MNKTPSHLQSSSIFVYSVYSVPYCDFPVNLGACFWKNVIKFTWKSNDMFYRCYLYSNYWGKQH